MLSAKSYQFGRAALVSISVALFSGAIFSASQLDEKVVAMLDGVIVSDYDGDQRSDILLQSNQGEEYRLLVSSGSSVQYWSDGFLGLNWRRKDVSLVVGDFNGDAAADIFLQSKFSGLMSQVIHSSLNGVVGELVQVIGDYHQGFRWDEAHHNLVVGDFDGDMRDDIFLQGHKSIFRHGVSLSNSEGLFNKIDLSFDDKRLGIDWSTADVVIFSADFDGDGKSELLIQPKDANGTVSIVKSRKELFDKVSIQFQTNYRGVSWSSIKRKIFVGDFNGDGKDDLFLMSRDNTERSVYLTSNSTDFSDVLSSIESIPNFDSLADAVVGDFDSNGVDELLLVYRDGAVSVLSAGEINADLIENVLRRNGLLKVGNHLKLLSVVPDSPVGVDVSSFGARMSAASPGPSLSRSVAKLEAQSPSIIQSSTTSAAEIVVGRTNGLFEVGSKGESKYTIPLFAPSGPNGMKPTIGLQYDSSSQYFNQDLRLLGAPGGMPQNINPISAGWLGVGWKVNGASAIGRCYKTSAQDAYSGGPNSIKYTDGTDAFCLDGSRLRLVSGTYGQSPSTYQTELETFSQITINSSDVYGPNSFEVRDASGLTYVYGGTTDSRIKFLSKNQAGQVDGVSPYKYEWALSKILDRSGNEINYVYSQDAQNGAYYLSEVSWGGNTVAATSSIYKLTFHYDTTSRQDPLRNIIVANFPSSVYKNIDQLWRISRVDLTYKPTNTLVRRYHVNYEPTSAVSKTSRIASIQECGLGESQCFSPTTFSWTNPGTLNTSESSSGQTVSSSYVMDINGDGLDDIVFSSSGTWRYILATKSGLATAVNTGFSASQSQVMPMDWNGDGRYDLLGVSGTTWWVMRSTGAGFSAWTNSGIAASTSSKHIAVDLNGDGRDDLVRASGTKVYARLNTGGALGNETVIQSLLDPISQIYSGTKRAPLDFDGDGREDFIVIRDYITSGPTSAIHSYIPVEVLSTSSITTASVSFDIYKWNGCEFVTSGDFNGDQKTDLAVRCNGSLKISAFPTSTSIPITSALGFLSADINGDGLDDVFQRGVSTYTVAQSTGSSLGTFQATTIPSTSAGVVSDIDGDGLDDIVRVDPSGILRYRPYVLAGTAKRPNLIESIIDAQGVSVTLTYSGLFDSAVHTPAISPAWPLSLPAENSISVVSSVISSDGSGAGSYTKTFHYESGLVNKEGRGFAGFAKQVVTDSRSPELRYETHFLQNFPYTGMISNDNIIKSANGAVVISVTNSWAHLALGSEEQSRAYPYIEELVKRTYELGGNNSGQLLSTATSTLNSAPDSLSGVATDISTVIVEEQTGLNPGASKSHRVQITSVLNNVDQWCVGRPQAVTTTSSHTLAHGETITNTEEFGWDEVKCRKTSHTREPDSSDWKVTTDFGFDDFGNIESETVTGINMLSRVSSVYWGPKGLRPETLTNALSQSGTRAWKHELGVMETETDPNGIISSSEYDAFGRLKKQIHFDGTATEYRLRACASTCDPRARYFVEKDYLDAGGVLVRTDKSYYDQFDREVLGQRVLANGKTANSSLTYFDTYGREERIYSDYLAAQQGNNGFQQFNYDALGRLTSRELRNPDGSLNRRVSFDYEGLSKLVTDPKGFRTRFHKTAWGDQIRVTDVDLGSAATNYSYDAAGKLRSVVDALGNTVSTMNYSSTGVKSSQTDINMGTWTYKHNALGELTHVRDTKTNASAWTQVMVYDKLGRVTQRTESEGTSTWTWGTSASNKNIGRLESISGPGYSESYLYDGLGRLSTKTINADASYVYGYDYNDLGQLKTLTYPVSTNGYRLAIDYGYCRGYLFKVTDSQGSSVFWKLNNVDATGKYSVESLGNGIKVTTSSDPLTGEMLLRAAGKSGSALIQNTDYGWDLNGNLERRVDRISGVTETFGYDAMDRLTTISGPNALSIQYNEIGNITYKSDVGTFTYHATKKHAVETAGGNSYSYDGNGNVESKNGSTVTWTTFNKPSVINQSGYSSSFSYTPNRARWRQIASYPTGPETTYYIGGLLEKIVSAGVTTYRHYIPAGNNKVILNRRSSGLSDWNYLTTDMQGSTNTVTDSAGSLVLQERYSAFGARRALNGGGLPSNAEMSTIQSITRRGYTGHEHLDNLGLVNMNGRIQDPTIGRFLSPDPYVQAPYNSQSLNRYSYVWNNPHRFLDPTGFTTGANFRPDDDPSLSSFSTASGTMVIYCSQDPVCRWNLISSRLEQAAVRMYLSSSQYIRQTAIVARAGVRAGFVADAVVPEPSDLAPPKWAGWVIAIGVTEGLVWVMQADDGEEQESLEIGEEASSTADIEHPENPPNPGDFENPDALPDGWEWRGKGEPGTRKGAYHNPDTGESMHDDRTHPPGKPGHWTYTDQNGKRWDNFGSGWAPQQPKGK